MSSHAGFGAQVDAFGSIGAGFGGIVSGLEGLFGTSTVQAQDQVTKGTVTEQLDISPEGVNKIIQDILSGEQGLAAIFGGEQSVGIFDSSVAAQAGGDLLSKLAGEIAKLTAKKTVATDTTVTSKVEGGTGGLLGQLF